MSTNPPEKRSIRYVCEMCRLSEAELNCVRMNIRRSPACRQLLMGMSISLYLPPIGTAGLERMSVSGKRRFPRPPPRMMARTSCMANRVGEHSSGGKPKGRSKGRSIGGARPAPLPRRQPHREDRAARRAVRRLHLAPEDFDQVFHDRQAQSRPAGFPRPRLVDAVEALEDPREVRLR